MRRLQIERPEGWRGRLSGSSNQYRAQAVPFARRPAQYSPAHGDAKSQSGERQGRRSDRRPAHSQARRKRLHRKGRSHLRLKIAGSVIPAERAGARERAGIPKHKTAGFPKFTDQVQHFLYKVLRWDDSMNSFRLKNAVQFPGLSQAGKTIRQIAAVMDRAPSTITRELKRNSGTQVGYQPAYAEQQAKSRRWRGSRLLRKPDLQEAVLKGLSTRLVASSSCRTT